MCSFRRQAETEQSGLCDDDAQGGAAPWTERSDAKTADCFNLQSAVPPRRAHEYMAVRLCIEVRPLVPKGILVTFQRVQNICASVIYNAL